MVLKKAWVSLAILIIKLTNHSPLRITARFLVIRNIEGRCLGGEGGSLDLHFCRSGNLPHSKLRHRDTKQLVTGPPAESISQFSKYNFIRSFHVTMCLHSRWGTLEVLRNIEAYWPNNVDNGKVGVRKWGKGKACANF